MNNEERFLTVAQVADKLQVHVETVRVWIRSGELDAVDIGNEYRIETTDLDDFLQKRKLSRRKSKEKNG